MKKIIMLLTLGCLFSANVFSDEINLLNTPLNINNEIDKTVTRFHQALREKNAKVVKMLLSKNVVIFESGNVENSLDEYASHHMQSDMKFMAAVNTEILKHEVNVYGDTAISLMSSRVSGKYRGEHLNYVGLETMTLVKVNDNWKITHIHWSK